MHFRVVSRVGRAGWAGRSAPGSGRRGYGSRAVRGHTPLHPTARDTLARLCDEVAVEHTSAADSGRTVRVSAVHRVGVLPVGEVAVVVVAVAPHRAEAFAACSEL
ncbi:hypothetical protein G6023_15445, partial [Dietzia sp. DQ11-71]|nr:hypothetical protein [Dietzia sp. DQ11-71]